MDVTTRPAPVQEVNFQPQQTRPAPAREAAPAPAPAATPTVTMEAPQPVVQNAQPQPVVQNARPDGGNDPYLARTENLREEDVSDYMMERAFSDANRALQGGAFRLSYGVHQATNRVIVSVYDSVTQELIREVPSESRLDLYARITEFTGLLFDSSL
ncbi:MAG: flagellar protein FlaG [Defluviitaleaceae bacterium]|nr:flagellar protein FlaG [Defluviitaleaceae bacterium]